MTTFRLTLSSCKVDKQTSRGEVASGLPVLCMRDELFVLQMCEGNKISKEHDV